MTISLPASKVIRVITVSSYELGGGLTVPVAALTRTHAVVIVCPTGRVVVGWSAMGRMRLGDIYNYEFIVVSLFLQVCRVVLFFLWAGGGGGGSPEQKVKLDVFDDLRCQEKLLRKFPKSKMQSFSTLSWKLEKCFNYETFDLRLCSELPNPPSGRGMCGWGG